MHLWNLSISPFCKLSTPSASLIFLDNSLYFYYSFDFVLLYLFFMAKIFSLIGISSFKKLSSSLTPYLSMISLSLSSFSSYSRYLISYCKPPIYYSSRTFWVGLFFKLLTVCSKFFFGKLLDFMRSCPSIFLVDPWAILYTKYLVLQSQI